MWLAPPFINQNATTEFAPLKLVIIAHTVSTECTIFPNCAAELRALQSYFATEFGYDIPYNFLIGNEGRVYEGRGWNRVGAHTLWYNPCTLSIAFIGDYREGLPSYSKVSDLQLERAQMLLAEGVERGYLQSDYHVVGQKDVITTVSPGANLYREIQKWKNYNTQYAGKSCEAIHGVNQTSVAAQTETPSQTYKNLKVPAPHEWFITREMWLAPPFINQNATTEFAPLKLVIIAHTVSAECTVFQDCAAELRSLQSYFATEYEYDIPYNFLIGNEGRVYEGRGWNRVGAHTLWYNPCTLSIAFIGDYREGLPSYSKVSDLQLERAQMLLAEGVERGYLQSDYHVVGQKDVITTVSPGANLYREIQKWKNYNTQYAGKSCEAIHGVNQTSVAAQTETPSQTFKNLKVPAPHEWFITREMWLAPPFINQNATTEFAPLKLVIIAHTLSTECTIFPNCAAELRALQSYFATEFGYDIPYNFLIGNEGRVYEGRGWNRVGAHTLWYNPCTLSIAFIGDYREGLPSYSKVSDLQLERAQMLLAEGVERGYLQSDYHVVGQKDVITTVSPGANLYREIQKWKNYNTQYAGKSCEAIHGVNQTSVAAQTETPSQTFKNLKAAPHEWFITREMWLAPPFINQNATTEFAPLKLVIIAHTVSAECTVFQDCAAELRSLQSYFATEYEYDIPYNFLIGNEGRVYEGRGWNRVGAHTLWYNPCTLSIAFIGDYREGLPSYSKVTDLQLERAQMLLAEGVERGYLQSDYHVVGQKDVITTVSPGANLYREIQKWKNYNTQYAGKSCEAIHGVNQTSVAAQTETPSQTFKNPTSNQSSDT